MIQVSPVALRRIAATLPEGCYFKIQVTAGGCSGFSQTFSIASTPSPDDVEIAPQVLVDTVTADLIGTAVLDYETNVVESKFVLKIAEATNTCGCGKSFSI